ncbi:hypothetical protein HJG60_012116 [Phyllostomus discolor]|uniref:Uncharacterized protein n=1 Tax=Phyllostomus discolor TaxID=89673 RepID=A0A834DWR3_9CHIR|nr:hypothetical protein HJG60_012116 [Phyllostomus discolor]
MTLSAHNLVFFLFLDSFSATKPVLLPHRTLPLLNSFLVFQYINILPLHFPHNQPEFQVCAHSFIHSTFIGCSLRVGHWGRNCDRPLPLPRSNAGQTHKFCSSHTHHLFWNMLISFSVLCFHQAKYVLLIACPCFETSGSHHCERMSYLLLTPCLSWVCSANRMSYTPRQPSVSAATIHTLCSLYGLLPALHGVTQSCFTKKIKAISYGLFQYSSSFIYTSSIFFFF